LLGSLVVMEKTEDAAAGGLRVHEYFCRLSPCKDNAGRRAA